MKKKYINPTIEVIDIKPTAILMNSVNSVTGLTDVDVSDDEFGGGSVD